MKLCLRALAPFASLLLALVSTTSDADACGGCFHPKTETGSSVITDHRMVFKISPQETILWDQVRYSGDPVEFAWVLPVGPGARVELSRDEWIAALDGATRTTVKGPEVFCNQPASSGRSSSSSSSLSTRSSSGGGGCGGGASDDSWQAPQSNADESSGGSRDGAASFAGNESVEVVSQSVIGPYQAVTIRSSQGEGISDWLTANGFAIPKEVTPIINAYTKEKLDFIALRLKPGASTRAMRPVRVVTPGADTTLPLRMVTAGVGSHVGLTLWVVSEARYQTKNFPNVPVDYTKLAWDGSASRSNLSELQRAALASGDGRGWITEAAIRANVVAKTYTSPNPTLFDAYTRQCETKGSRSVPCDETELPPANGTPEDMPDAGDADAGDADAGTTDAGTDAGHCVKIVRGCDGYDDLAVATRGLHTSDVWVTRLRADLPVSALVDDLRLEPAVAQTEDNPARHTEIFTSPSFDPCNGRGVASPSNGASSATSTPSGGCTCRMPAPLTRDTGTFLLVGLTAVGAAMVTRRRRS